MKMRFRVSWSDFFEKYLVKKEMAEFPYIEDGNFNFRTNASTTLESILETLHKIGVKDEDIFIERVKEV